MAKGDFSSVNKKRKTKAPKNKEESRLDAIAHKAPVSTEAPEKKKNNPSKGLYEKSKKPTCDFIAKGDQYELGALRFLADIEERSMQFMCRKIMWNAVIKEAEKNGYEGRIIKSA